MANVNTPFGLRPVRTISGSPYSGQYETFSVAAGNGVAIGIGDPVTIAGTAQIVNGEFYRDVVQAATGGVVQGVCVGVVPVTAESTRHRVASTLRLIMVATDPHLVFEIQEIGTGTQLTNNDSGFNADFIAATPNATTGLSGFLLNNVGEATTNTLDLKILNPVRRADNAIGAYCKWEVMINRHQYANQVAGI